MPSPKAHPLSSPPKTRPAAPAASPPIESPPTAKARPSPAPAASKKTFICTCCSEGEGTTFICICDRRPPIESPSTAKALADDKKEIRRRENERKKEIREEWAKEFAKKNEAKAAAGEEWAKEFAKAEEVQPASAAADAEEVQPAAIIAIDEINMHAGLPSGSRFEEVAQPGDDADKNMDVEDSSDDEAWGKRGKRRVGVYKSYAKRIKMQDMVLPKAAPKQREVTRIAPPWRWAFYKSDFKPPANLTIRTCTIGWRVSGAKWQHRWEDLCSKGPDCLQKRAKAVWRELQPEVT